MPLSKQERRESKKEDSLCERYMKKYLKEEKMLVAAYKKRMEQLIKAGTASYQANLDFLYVYLQFLSDIIFLNKDAYGIDDKEMTKVLKDIATAMSKYEDYLTCHEKYFEIKNGKPVSKTGKSEEDTYTDCEIETKKLFGEFCDMLKEHIFEWNLDIG